jgi:uncharacterized protein YuzE
LKRKVTCKAKKVVAPVEKKLAQALKVKTDEKGAISGFETVVNRLAELESVLTPEIEKAIKEQSRLESELRAVADQQVAADAKVVFTGTSHDFVVSEKGEKREVVVQQARIALGEKLFNDVARILLSDVDKYLTADQQATCVVRSPSGPRKGQLIRRG